MTAEESRMSAYSVTDTRYGEVLAARGGSRVNNGGTTKNGCGSPVIFARRTATVPPIPRAFHCL